MILQATVTAKRQVAHGRVELTLEPEQGETLRVCLGAGEARVFELGDAVTVTVVRAAGPSP